MSSNLIHATMKKIILIVMLVAISACGTAKSPELDDPFYLIKYDHFGDYSDPDKGDCTVVLYFKEPLTNKEVHSDDMQCNNALRKLEWLQKGQCYTNALSATEHINVSCG